jgi:hypothetical protein
VRRPHAFVFSDDPAWCRDNLRLPVPTTIVDRVVAVPAHEDMNLLSQCRHHVIANSSFSWWGAWLGKAPDKRVVAPRRWLAQDPQPMAVVPSDWARIDD